MISGRTSRLLPDRFGWLAAVIVAVAVFGAIWPTLSWQEFSGGSENLNIQTVLELCRGECEWYAPTLQGKLRTQKPPLTAWITAAGVSRKTVAALSDADPVRRERAYHQLAGEARWTALLSACAMLVSVYGLGRLGGDTRLGIAAAIICGSNLLFLKQARQATTDVQLALWVSVTNLLLAYALLAGRWWRGCLLGGLSLGLAFMSKGPVALIQTVVPLALYVVWRKFWRAEATLQNPAPCRPSNDSATKSPALLAMIAGAAVFTAVAFPWFVYMLLRQRGDGLMHLWLQEVLRESATEMRPDPRFQYLLIIPFMFPWAIFVVVGLIGATIELIRGAGQRIALPLLLFVVPVIAMTFIGQDRKDRYLLPMLGPASIVAAWGLRQTWQAFVRRRKEGPLLLAAHWALLGVVAVALPIAAAIGTGQLRTLDGEPWFAWSLAVAAAGAMSAILGGSLWLARRWREAMVIGTFTVMMILQAVTFYGYVQSDDARADVRPLADAILRSYPDAVLSYLYHRRVPNDATIYLNRTAPQVDGLEEAVARAKKIGGPAVVLTFQKHGQPEPIFSIGWLHIGKTGRDNNWLHAWVLPRSLPGKRLTRSSPHG